MPKPPIVLSEALTPPPVLIRAGLEALPTIIRGRGERTSRCFIEIFTGSIRKNRRGTTKLYDRTREELSFGEVAWIKF